MSFDETVIHCSAPALCGIKPASLFSMGRGCFASGAQKLADWRREFSREGRYFVPLKKADGRVLFFVFDKALLAGILSEKKNCAYLMQKGYPVQRGFCAVLAELLHRLVLRADFPHEVGLFLGYPLEDVQGFEADSRAFKYAGTWKVYGDPAEAARRMALYKSCSDTCTGWVCGGMSVPRSVRRYITRNL